MRAEVDPGTAERARLPAAARPRRRPAPSVTFPAGTASGTTLPLHVPVRGDTLDEPNETFPLALDARNDATLPEPDSVAG